MPRAAVRARDVSKPKGRKSAFVFYLEACREELRRKNQQVPPMTDMKELYASAWNDLSEQQRESFNQLAEKDKLRFNSEMQDYNPEQPKKERKQKKPKDPNAPKRFLSAFFWFSNEERANVRKKNPDAGIGGIAKELGKMWNEIDPDVKQKYVRLAEVDRARYDQEMADYRGE